MPRNLFVTLPQAKVHQCPSCVAERYDHQGGSRLALRAQSVNERAWSMASAPSALSMTWQQVVHSMEGSPNDAVLLLTSNTYQASGEQQQAMVIREVCPECKSARYKKNGHLHKPTAPRVWSHWRAVVRLARSTSPACSTAARRAVAAARMRLIAS